MMGRRYLGGDEIAAFCYQVGELLDLRLPPEEGEEKGKVIPIRWRSSREHERGQLAGFSEWGTRDVCLHADYFLLLASSGREVRPGAASTYVHECAHKIVELATKELDVPRSRKAWYDTGHDYVFAVVCWSLFARLHLKRNMLPELPNERWWYRGRGPDLYDIADAVFIPTDRSQPDNSASLEVGFERFTRWWILATKDALIFSKNDTSPLEIAKETIKKYIRLTTPKPAPPPPTRWERVKNWFLQ